MTEIAAVAGRIDFRIFIRDSDGKDGDWINVSFYFPKTNA